MENDSYSEIGRLLFAARLEKRLTLEEASQALHIRLRYLKALEEGNLSQLPGLPYVRGYLQSYAAFLGLDKHEVVRRFERVEKMLARDGFYFPKVFSKEKKPSPRIVWGSLAVAVLAYLFWALALQPGHFSVSLVEHASHAPPAPLSLSIDAGSDDACFQDDIVLYPPCTMAGERVFEPLPLHRQQDSVMDLADLGLAQ